MAIRTLKTVEAVIEALGRPWIYAATGKEARNVWDWCSRGKFPPELYDLMTTKLKKLGYRAPQELWSQAKAQSGRAA